MKFNVFSTGLTLIGLTAFLGFSSMRNPSNPPTGRTGAPGEGLCTASGCHNGGSFTGTVTLSGVPDTVVPNQTYTITLTNKSNAVKAGFQITCLDGANAKAGTFTVGTGCNVTTASGRQYCRQSTPKTLSGGQTSWTFPWKAPATASGNTCKFYFASLCANGTGNNNGDNTLNSNKTVVLQQASAANEPALETWADLRFLSGQKTLEVGLKQDARGQIQVVDASGKLVFESALSADNQLDMSRLPTGLFVANVTAGGKSGIKKFMVN